MTIDFDTVVAASGRRPCCWNADVLANMRKKEREREYGAIVHFRVDGGSSLNSAVNCNNSRV